MNFFTVLGNGSFYQFSAGDDVEAKAEVNKRFPDISYRLYEEDGNRLVAEHTPVDEHLRTLDDLLNPSMRKEVDELFGLK